MPSYMVYLPAQVMRTYQADQEDSGWDCIIASSAARDHCFVEPRTDEDNARFLAWIDRTDIDYELE